MNAIAPAARQATLPFYWSVRRELWENRSIYIAPLVVAAIALAGTLITMVALPQKIRGLAALDPVKQVNAVVMPYSLVASLIILSSFVVGVFYCFGALNGERRDRSILFWKSMPVSDLTTVLSKASIPLCVLPAIAFTVVLGTQLVMLLASVVVLLASGVNPEQLWTPLPIFRITVVMLYGILVHALWFAPIYAWVLLVSAWARRAAFLWAVLPFVAAGVIERIALGTYWSYSALKYRLLGAMSEAFAPGAGHTPITQLAQLDPGKLLSTPNFWLGLAFAAVCLAAAVRLRRIREPI